RRHGLRHRARRADERCRPAGRSAGHPLTRPPSWQTGRMTDEAPDDPYLWLEDVTGDDALCWVLARNAVTTATYTDRPRDAALRDEIREALDADDRIPYVRRRG